jgi:hypothetical protein
MWWHIGLLDHHHQQQQHGCGAAGTKAASSSSTLDLYDSPDARCGCNPCAGLYSLTMALSRGSQPGSPAWCS